MSEIPNRAAALIFDENGVWLVMPQDTEAGASRDAPPHVLAACELAARIQTPCAIETLAAAFQKRNGRG